jgi:hypothetical protein
MVKVDVEWDIINTYILYIQIGWALVVNPFWGTIP